MHQRFIVFFTNSILQVYLQLVNYFFCYFNWDITTGMIHYEATPELAT